MSLSIRRAQLADAERLVEMIHAFAVDVHEAAAASRDQVERDAIGLGRLVETLLAESDGQVVGYAMFQPSLLSFSGTRGVILTDLYVAG